MAAAASRAGAKPEARADAEAAAAAAADADPEAAAAADPQNSMTEEYGYDDYNYGAGEYEDDYYGKIHQILEPSKST